MRTPEEIELRSWVLRHCCFLTDDVGELAARVDAVSKSLLAFDDLSRSTVQAVLQTPIFCSYRTSDLLDRIEKLAAMCLLAPGVPFPSKRESASSDVPRSLDDALRERDRELINSKFRMWFIDEESGRWEEVLFRKVAAAGATQTQAPV